MDSIRVLLDDRAKALRQRLVREEMMAIIEVPAAHRGVAAEFAGIGDKQGGPAVGENGLSRLNFAGMKIEQRSILVDAADAEDSDVGLEAGKEALRRLEKGTFGICRDCGEEIAAPRLNAIPWTRVCITCKEKQSA